MKFAKGVAAATMLLTVAAPAVAQNYFGQNQVQYDRFDWKVLETEHFLIYYYPEERPATLAEALRVAQPGGDRLA